MSHVVAKTFASPLTVREMARRAVLLGGAAWTSRESETEGVYLRGMTTDGVKIRVVEEGGRYAAEVYFPLSGGHVTLPGSRQREVLNWLDRDVLRTFEARDVRADP